MQEKSKAFGMAIFKDGCADAFHVIKVSYNTLTVNCFITEAFELAFKNFS